MSTATEKGFTLEAITLAKLDCIRWLDENDHDWVMPWDKINVDVFNRYSLAPPIAGYEELERDGIVINRGLVDAGAGKRIQFDKVL